MLVCGLAHHLGVQPSLAAIEKDQENQGSHPKRFFLQSEQTKTSHADETNGGGDFQAANRADPEPKQGAKDLAAIEWIDGQHIEDQQPEIDGSNHTDEVTEIRPLQMPSSADGEQVEKENRRYERDIDQRSRRDAPELRASAERRMDVCRAAERPENDLFGLTARLAASEGVAKLMGEDDRKQREVFGDRPNRRRVERHALTDGIVGEQQPRPVDENIDSSEAE